MYGHRYLENIKKLYITAGKYDDKQKYKAMIEALMVSKPEGCTNNIPTTPNPYLLTKNPSVRKLLPQFTETLNVKHNTAVQRFGEAKAKRKAIKTCNVLWSNIEKRRGHT